MSKPLSLKRIILSSFLSFYSLILFAQPVADSSATNVDAVMRSNDKIYVVMAVCITILVVLIIYLIRIDLKISKKEKAN